MVDVNDIIEGTAEVTDVVSVGKLLHNAWHQIATRRMTNFFRECARQVDLNDCLSDEFQAKLNRYVKSQIGQDTTYSLVSKALNTDSERCCRLLGIILGWKMRNNDKLSYRDRTIANALSAMSDDDLQLLFEIHSNFNNLPVPPEIIDKAKGDQENLRDEMFVNSVHIQDFHDHGLISGNLDEHLYSVERMKSLGVLSATAIYEGSGQASTEGLLRLNRLSEEIMHLAKIVEEGGV